ncbi:MAG: hypothetical protein JO115_23050 [Pseudonocardiales bacterium]|nr:hypothetical protein [Pseudonocardiales bacterium]
MARTGCSWLMRRWAGQTRSGSPEVYTRSVGKRIVLLDHGILAASPGRRVGLATGGPLEPPGRLHRGDHSA